MNHSFPHCPLRRFCPQKSVCQFRHVKDCPLLSKCPYPVCSYYHPPPNLLPPNLLYNLPILPTRPALPPPIPQTPTHPGWSEPGIDTEKNCQNLEEKVSITDLQSKLLGFETELEEYRKRACQDKQITTKLTTFIQMAEEWHMTLNDLINTTQGLEEKVTETINNNTNLERRMKNLEQAKLDEKQEPDMQKDNLVNNKEVEQRVTDLQTKVFALEGKVEQSREMADQQQNVQSVTDHLTSKVNTTQSNIQKLEVKVSQFYLVLSLYFNSTYT